MKPAPKPGVYRDVPESEYREWDAINVSSFSDPGSEFGLCRSAAHWKWAWDHPQPATPAMLLGSGLHCLMLEGSKKFNATYFTGGPVNPKTGQGYGRDTKAFAEWANVQCLTHPGAKFITEEQAQAILNMGESLMCHQSARPIISLSESGANEVSIVAEVDGVPVKARIDMLRPEFSIIADLKTTADASWRGFSRSIAKYGYHRQAAWYLDICHLAGIDVSSFAFLCVESEPPYAVGCYRLQERDIAIGREQCAGMMDMIREGLRTGEWPAYCDVFTDIGMNDWAAAKAEKAL